MSDLALKATELRRTIFETGMRAGTGHIPGCFSWVEIAVALYCGGVLNFRSDEPKWPDRDRFILSKGHACLTLYAILADLGFFPREEMDRYCAPGSTLEGHPSHLTPGIECSTGSLGHGLGIGAGMALSGRIAGKSWRTFVVMGDGECDEGSVWEAAEFASRHRLGRLAAIVDCNGFGATERVDSRNLPDKFSAFGWDVVIGDGHDVGNVIASFASVTDRPRVLIAKTVKGKGVPFMEDSEKWHHQMPKGEQIEEARRALA